MGTALRIIRDSAPSGAFNMAADVYLMDRAARMPDTVCLRLYGWEKTTVSLGCMQNAERDLDPDAMGRDGVDWVKRPTGGRAVLHDHDITYSIVFPLSLRALGNTVAQTYRIVSDCLTAGLTRAGIRSASHNSKLDTELVRTQTKLPCFLAPNRHEIMVDDRKLVGSAQKRTSSAVLQHGSIPLTPAFRRMPLYSKVSDERRAEEMRLFEQKCTCVEEILPDVGATMLVGCLVKGFEEALELEGEERGWSEKERRQIEEKT